MLSGLISIIKLIGPGANQEIHKRYTSGWVYEDISGGLIKGIRHPPPKKKKKEHGGACVLTLEWVTLSIVTLVWGKCWSASTSSWCWPLLVLAPLASQSEPKTSVSPGLLQAFSSRLEQRKLVTSQTEWLPLLATVKTSLEEQPEPCKPV